MARPAKLAPLLDRPKKLWYLYLNASLSPTGKPKREYVRSKKEAESKAEYWRKVEQTSAEVVRRAGPDLIKTAVNYDEIFRAIYGIEGGLAEACEAYMEILDSQQNAARFGTLLDAFEKEHYNRWAEGTQSTYRNARSPQEAEHFWAIMPQLKNRGQIQ